jgi:ATP synthase protein I
MADMPDERSPKKMWVGAEKYIQLGLTIPAATVIGWILGQVLQHWLQWGWLPIGGVVLGSVAGLVYFIRIALSEDFKE